MRWDVFCRVVDNYGDAGVCWRLARQLAREHGFDVTLWIDRVATLAKIEPAIDPRPARQVHRGVTVAALDARADDAVTGAVRAAADSAGAAFDPGDVVIEGFGCGLPARYLDAMEARKHPPLWINLEYLSAEPWVDGVHGLASRHPQRPLTRYFWFPGFTAKTGGLIREAGLIEARDAAQREHSHAWPASGEHAAAGRADGAAPVSFAAPELSIVLFCYANRALPALFDLWARGDRPMRCIVPEGIASAELAGWLGSAVPPAPRRLTRDRLTIEWRPFTSQDAFDRLLWASDVNFVRGEDSFVRAQWAAKPFVWQPYPQEGRAQAAKLEAFLARHLPDASNPSQQAQRRLMRAFDAEDPAGVARAWPGFHAALESAGARAREWAATLAGEPDLVTQLVEFARTKL
jgi:uncharacterized repeat protein (TIGR03837 family)